MVMVYKWELLCQLIWDFLEDFKRKITRIYAESEQCHIIDSTGINWYLVEKN